MVSSPKRDDTPLPPDLVRRPVAEPVAIWTWALVSRRDEPSRAVQAAIEALTRDITVDLDLSTSWLPADDPFRQA